MTAWHPHSYSSDGLKQGVDPTVLAHAVAAGLAVTKIDPQIPPILSLRHLAHIVEVDYGLIRAIVSRQSEPYKVFRIRKRASSGNDQRFRVICVPDFPLMLVQRWINARILSRVQSHPASVAYNRGSSIYKAAERHCGCRWLIKLDITKFFESISEIAVYRIFRELDYQPLVAFELGRLCTRLGDWTHARRRSRWLSTHTNYSAIAAYKVYRMGHLPQGAPTSPVLANLAMRSFDAQVEDIAQANGLVYTRYADDLTFSTADPDFGRWRAEFLIRHVYSLMGQVGLSPNIAKTRLCPPGARKLVLGLLVDGNAPRLSRQFKSNLRQHLYYLLHPRIGPMEHANRRKFAAIGGLHNHLAGLVAFAKQIEPKFGGQCSQLLDQIAWPY